MGNSFGVEIYCQFYCQFWSNIKVDLRLNYACIMSTNNYIFDTDCLSTFFHANCEGILLKVFKKLIVPKKVYDELCQYNLNLS